jgi:hypothetical protein
VASQDFVFSTWSPRFPKVVARYVRLRVQRSTAFHLEEVKVF